MEERKDTTGLGDTGKCANDTCILYVQYLPNDKSYVRRHMSEKVVS